MAMCSIQDCTAAGSHRVSDYVPTTYVSKDDPIMFCSEHIDEMVELYSIYKGLEAEMPTGLIRCAGGWLRPEEAWIRSLIEKRPSGDEIASWIYDAGVVITLRKRFQGNLKREISGAGHVGWIGLMEEFKKYAEEIFDERGIVNWTNSWKEAISKKEKRRRRNLPWC